jgi:hypothetical protein
MGTVANIGMYCFPRQSDWVGRRVRVCFHYDTEVAIGGEMVRDDYEAPWLCIIKLDDGRYVMATECQYTEDRQ